MKNKEIEEKIDQLLKNYNTTPADKFFEILRELNGLHAKAKLKKETLKSEYEHKKAIFKNSLALEHTKISDASLERIALSVPELYKLKLKIGIYDAEEDYYGQEIEDLIEFINLIKLERRIEAKLGGEIWQRKNW